MEWSKEDRYRRIDEVSKEELNELPASVEKFDRSYIYHLSRVKLPKVQTKEIKKSVKTILSKPNLYQLMKLIYITKVKD